MMTITADILKTAFRKLLSAVYYDKTDMVMRYYIWCRCYISHKSLVCSYASTYQGYLCRT